MPKKSNSRIRQNSNGLLDYESLEPRRVFNADLGNAAEYNPDYWVKMIQEQASTYKRPLDEIQVHDQDLITGKRTTVSLTSLIGTESSALGSNQVDPREGLATSGVDFVFGNDTRSRIPQEYVTSFPYSTQGQLSFSNGNEAYICSASLIDEFHVLTAAHCVSDGAGNSYSNFKFEAGKDGPDYRYYGTANATRVRWFSGFNNGNGGNLDWDMALITLDRNLGTYTGWMGYGYNSNDSWYSSQTGQVIGYPGETPDGSNSTMWQVNGNPVANGINTNEFRNYLDITGGMSGGPLNFNNYVHGVVSYGSFNDSNGNGQYDQGEAIFFNAQNRMTQPKFDAFQAAIATDDNEFTPTDLADLVSWDEWFNESIDFTPKSNYYSGELIEIDAFIRNMGTATAGSFDVQFRLSTDSVFDASDTFIGNATINGLAPFDWATAEFNGSLPTGAIGNYYIVYSVDSSNTVNEFTNSDVSNNGFLKVPIQISAVANDSNDQISESIAITVGTTGTGLISSGTDVDMWRFAAQAGREYYLDIDIAGRDLDSILRLFDSTGNQLAFSDDDQGPGDEPYNLESYIAFVAPSNGNYFMGISSFGNSQYDPLTGLNDSLGTTTGNYVLSVTSTDSDVRQEGNTVFVTGSTADDEFEIRVGQNYDITFNGIFYAFSRSAINSIVFEGNGGNDAATIIGSIGDDTANLSVNYGTVNGPGYEIAIQNSSTINVFGGAGNDIAYFSDSPDDDLFLATPIFAKLSGFGFFNSVSNFSRVVAVARNGGQNDQAIFRDSAGNDTYFATPETAQMRGGGYFNFSRGFNQTFANATAGGNDDRAILIDSSGNDEFYATPFFARITGNGFKNRALGFDRVSAFASEGGNNDHAIFRDSAGDDEYTATPNVARMSGSGFFNFSSGFERTSALATEGGNNDRAILRDSSGNDEFFASPTIARLRGNGFVNYTKGFERASALATEGGNDDRAFFRDSSGNDEYYTTPSTARMSGNGFRNYASGFDRTSALATFGNDQAYFDDSAGNDNFFATPFVARMSGNGFFNYVQGFDVANAFAKHGGNDLAILDDSNGDDLFFGRSNRGYMTNGNYRNFVSTFDRVTIRGQNGGQNVVDVNFLLYALDEIGNWS